MSPLQCQLIVFLFCQGHEAQFHQLQLAFLQSKEWTASSFLDLDPICMRVTTAPVSIIRETIFLSMQLGRVHYNYLHEKVGLK